MSAKSHKKVKFYIHKATYLIDKDEIICENKKSREYYFDRQCTACFCFCQWNKSKRISYEIHAGSTLGSNVAWMPLKSIEIFIYEYGMWVVNICFVIFFICLSFCLYIVRSFNKVVLQLARYSCNCTLTVKYHIGCRYSWLWAPHVAWN